MRGESWLRREGKEGKGEGRANMKSKWEDQGRKGKTNTERSKGKEVRDDTVGKSMVGNGYCFLQIS